MSKLLREVPSRRGRVSPREDERSNRRREQDLIADALAETERYEYAHAQDMYRAQQEQQMMREFMAEMGGLHPQDPRRAAHEHMREQHYQQQPQDYFAPQRRHDGRFDDPVRQRGLLTEVPQRGMTQRQMVPQRQQPQLLREVPNRTGQILTDMDPRWRPRKLERCTSEYTQRWNQILERLEGQSVRRSNNWERIDTNLTVRNPFDQAVKSQFSRADSFAVMEDSSIQNAPKNVRPNQYREVQPRNVDLGGILVESFN